MTTVMGGVNAPPSTLTPEGDWARLSALLTEEVDVLTGSRTDVVVAITPGAAGPTCAMFDPSRGVIEIDGEKLPKPPAWYLPAGGKKKRQRWEYGLEFRKREQMEGVYGLLVHEASHATHTRWTADASKAVDGYVKTGVWTRKHASRIVEAALMLEEIRVETKAVKASWWTRRWQRLAAVQHLLGNINPEQVHSRVAAGTVATLVGGRVAADILSSAETEYLRMEAAGVLGYECYDQLVNLCTATVNVPDGDAIGMINAAIMWCDLVYQGDPGDDPGNDMMAASGAKMAELAEQLGAVIIKEGGLPGWAPATYEDFLPEWRSATPEEKGGAAKLRDRLLPYFLPERSTTRRDKAVPPGRLRGSVALRAAAQHAQGLPPSADPWRFTDRKVVPVPPLRAGLVLDVSGSMKHLQPMAQGIAYRFGTALGRLPDAVFRGALAGYGTAPIGQKPGEVPEYHFHHSQQHLHAALEDLTERLDLYRRDAARLVVVMSDCQLTSSDEQDGTPAVVRKLTAAGCRVLWLGPESEYASDQMYGEAKREIQLMPGVTWIDLPGSHEVRREHVAHNWVEAAIATAEDALVQVMTAS